MFAYYTNIFIITNLTLIILIYLVHENARMPKIQKRRFYHTYCAIMGASIAEWLGIILNGAPMWTRYIHIFVKVVGYLLHPLIAYFFFIQIREKGWVMEHFQMNIVLAFIFMLLSLPFGSIVYVDDHNYYHHGNLYFLYSIIYIFMLILLIIGFLKYGRKHRHHNDISLILISLLVIGGSVAQQLGEKLARTFFLSVSIAAVLLFVHYEEYYQQEMDEDDEKKTILLEKDALTNLYSRYAFNQMLRQYAVEKMEEKFSIFVIDINGLKTLNDSKGHEAGDALICAAALSIENAAFPYGKVYRTGGDEFVVFLDTSFYREEEFIKKMNDNFIDYSKPLNFHLSAAVGSVQIKDYPDLTLEQLVDIADKRMYENKKKYYLENHTERRF